MFDDDEISRGTKDPFMYDAVVIDRDDPKGLGRVRYRIPGKVEESPWAWPSATLGGGSKNRGFFAVPEMGADITVWFNQGNQDEPRYMCAHWGRPGGESEVPAEALDPDVRVFATETFRIEINDAEGTRALRLTNLKTDDYVELDAERNALTIFATTALILRSVGIIDIQADSSVQIQGRTIAPTTVAI